MSIIEELFNVFAPHECLVCKKEGDLICKTCLVGLQRVPPRCYSCQRWSEAFRTCERCRRQSPLFQVWAFTSFDGVAKDVIHALKFARAKAAGRIAGHSLTTIYTSTADEVLIAHLPTAADRIRERGYDQAALIARAFSRELGRPHLPLLARTGSQRQLGQSRTIRKQQLEAAFRPLHADLFRGKHILLVDDVLTTGATCEAAARVLRQAGAKRVSAAVFAVA
jgi:ComF family protein